MLLTKNYIYLPTGTISAFYIMSHKIKDVGMSKYYGLLFFFFILTCNSHAEIKLTFGLYTADKPTVMVANFRPILNHLEDKLTEQFSEEVHIRLQVFSTYEKGVEAIVTGEVDFTQLGPASYVFAKNDEPGLKILAMENQKGQKIFKGIICIREDSPIKSIKDLKGKSFAFGNSRSTIGRYLSQNYMMSEGIYADDLIDFSYLGRHDTVGTAVNAGDYDAGALKEGTFNKLIARGAKLKKLVEFDNVTKPWVARKGLNEIISSAISKALLELNEGEILKGISKQGFLPGDDSDYENTRQAIKRNDHFTSNIKEKTISGVHND